MQCWFQCSSSLNLTKQGRIIFIADKFSQRDERTQRVTFLCLRGSCLIPGYGVLPKWCWRTRIRNSGALMYCQQCCQLTVLSFFSVASANPKLLQMGFSNGNANTTWPVAMKMVCYLKSSLMSFKRALCVRKEPCAVSGDFAACPRILSILLPAAGCCVQAGWEVAEKKGFKHLAFCVERAIVHPLFLIETWIIAYAKITCCLLFLMKPFQLGV